MAAPLPTFRTPRLTVRPRDRGDLENCLAMDSDPEVTRFLPVPWTDPMTHRTFVEDRMRYVYPVGMGYWSIVATEGFVGWVLLTPLDLHGPEIEIAWRLVRAAWGRGYATEAARPVLDHALTTLGLQEVIADIDPENRASVRVAQKLGLRSAGLVHYHGYTFARFVAHRAAVTDASLVNPEAPR
jgi:RimJ/RimL family protein N-acetyltransferase